MMIDLHSHILPELDDGAQNLQQSLEMARIAIQSGVTTMVATPHCIDGQAEDVRSMLKLMRSVLRENGLRLQLCSGMEIFGTRDTARLLREGKLLTLNRSQYPLIEFNFHSDGYWETQILSDVIQAGYRPVVAHPERYSFIQHSPELLNRWVQMGCLLQINKGSLLGRFGSTSQSLSLELVDRGFATVVASDAHSTHSRTPWMAEVRTLLELEFAPEAARYLLLDNPRRILKNVMVPPVEPGWF
jgi:protein-tyrosine phosphatase